MKTTRLLSIVSTAALVLGIIGTIFTVLVPLEDGNLLVRSAMVIITAFTFATIYAILRALHILLER